MPYIEVRRRMPGGKIQWEAYSPDGKLLLRPAKRSCGPGSNAETLNRRKQICSRVYCCDIPAEIGTHVTAEYIRSEIQQHDEDFAARQAELQASLQGVAP